MLVLIDKENNLITIFNNKDEIEEFINNEKLIVDTTLPNSYLPTDYVFKTHESVNWEFELKEIFKMEIEEIEIGTTLEM